ncbi:LutC/YkgG family protein [Vibrio mangrovi]|uniref:Lactate utilization protein n=1 Tax=Vibrio mangrovi TaxID=474394 RepID=A0A1Y6IY88_9VIBR|nr:lactate utilization protein [Vibrio mangrovi]MDW6005013.1 lactate utilization protein [Vibrio mangrovi]SMS01780.1 Lactate utilization protein C [Vibrio mangrovi]
MSNARQQIFNKLNAARPTPLENGSAETARNFARHNFSDDQKLERFCAALDANHAQVLTIEREQLIQTVHELCAQNGWQHAAIGTSGLWHSDFRKGLENIQITEYQQTIDQWKDELFTTVDVGLTDTCAGIADTGALVLWPDIHQPRTLSLVPPCHVAVLRQSTLFDSFTDIMLSQQWHTQMPTNAVLISGPSKTADIQQTLAYGAHGPSQLIVVILKDE